MIQSIFEHSTMPNRDHGAAAIAGRRAAGHYQPGGMPARDAGKHDTQQSGCLTADGRRLMADG
jgi:hypothetical protein